VLLLAGFALLRPVAPGLWYIVGVAVRLGVDLGLHYEDGVGIDGSGSEDHAIGRADLKTEPSVNDDTSSTAPGSANTARIDAKERGRRQWVRDLRRRLWWCVYSVDRLVSTCVGRPFVSNPILNLKSPSPNHWLCWSYLRARLSLMSRRLLTWNRVSQIRSSPPSSPHCSMIVSSQRRVSWTLRHTSRGPPTRLSRTTTSA
jgi:hypothetical protein